MASILTDFTRSARRLTQTPGFSLAVLIMLALGIAFSTSMVGVLRGVLGSLPFPQPEQVVVLESASAERGVSQGGLTPAEALRLSAPDTPFAEFGYYTWGGMTVTLGERPREISTSQVSPGFFPALGMQPLLGRWFIDAEFDAASDAVVLAHAEWQRLFGGDPEVLGRHVETTEGRLRVVGVMPPTFAIPSEVIGAWRPQARDGWPLDQPWAWNARFVAAVARLDPALGEAALAQRLDALSAELAERHQLPQGQWQLRPRALLDVIIGDLRGVLWGAFAVAVLVLLIACANAALLIDARQLARRHQQAVEQALGASPRRLYGALILEVGLLTLLAVALGVALALFGLDTLRELARSSLPRVDAIAIDGVALGVAATLGLLAPLVAALAGALRPHAEPSEAMRGGGKGVVGHARRRFALPALGVALSTVSLVAGSALLFSLWRLQAVDPGLRHEHVYVYQLFHGGEVAHSEFARRLRERLLALPGVEQVAVSSSAPLASQIGNMSIDLKLPERAQPEPWNLGLRRVSPEYAGLLRIPLLHGRMFDADDRPGSERVAIINRELGRRLFGGDSPLDRIVELPLGHGPRVPYRIVGVSEDIRNNGLRAAPEPELWIPFAAEPSMAMSILVAASRPLAGHEKLFADALYAVDPREAVTLAMALSDGVDAELAPVRFFTRTVGAFALAALLLAAFGVYAVATLRQQSRTAEFGLRLAIGARPFAVAVQMLGESARAVLLGIALGMAGAWAALRLLQAQLFGLEGTHTSALAAGVGLLLGVALLAAALPALRAARIDPMQALRHD